jgi:hypothetical protein
MDDRNVGRLPAVDPDKIHQEEDEIRRNHISKYPGDVDVYENQTSE